MLPSQAKNRLYVGNIPKSLSHDQLVDTLKPLTKGACWLLSRQDIHRHVHRDTYRSLQPDLLRLQLTALCLSSMSVCKHCIEPNAPVLCPVMSIESRPAPRLPVPGAGQIEGDARPEPRLLLRGVPQLRLCRARKERAVTARLHVRSARALCCSLPHSLTHLDISQL